jgi:hypothetical protein
MRSGIEQDLVLVLTVEIDERPGGVAERGAGDQRAVHERTAAPLRGHLAAHDQLGAVGGFEHGLDCRRILAGAHQFRAGATADEQADRPDEDRLACAGFAGEHVEAGGEFELQAIDDRQICHAEEPDHRDAHPARGGSSILSDL